MKEKLGVYKIFYQSPFVAFWLSPWHKLTYLPDTLDLSQRSNRYWMEDFSKGRWINKNWNLRKYDEEGQ